MSAISRSVAVALACVIAAPAAATAVAADRITTTQARAATTQALHFHAELVGGTLRVSPRCPERGRASRVCTAWIRGSAPECYRVTVTLEPGESYVLRARRCR